ncbi:MAG: hypothetical protein M1834_008019 [Cirrosporium novae-zelandiae]|nr:MAG: hypothetical protein M1834_008019 [Cirrosporium novae-zelandiae]
MLFKLLLPLFLGAYIYSYAEAFALECDKSAFAAIIPSSATILYAEKVSANGSFGGGAADLEFPTNATELPELCAIAVNVISSNVSSFNFGLFLPAVWNSRFIATGNGGFGGGINWPVMGTFSHYGFASMSTDTGHISISSNASWALDAPEKRTDWGYRAMHGSIVLSKQIIAVYYNSSIKYSYYSGCSTGGRQGLKEAEMFPDDFDGIVVGAPAWWTTHLQTWSTKVGMYNLPTNASHHIPDSLFSTISAEVFRQCDPQDGLVDNIISDPAGCDFFPEALLCGSDSNTSACLTAPQIETLYHVYNDYVDVNQTFVFPHLELGSEDQWSVLLGVTDDEPSPYGISYISNFLMNDPNWDWHDFDYSVVELADKLDPGNATANNFNLSSFYSKGGKLMQYHGLADGLIATGSSVYFYKHVLRTLLPKGIELDDFYRFFLVPGMQHCSGSVNDAPWYFAGASQNEDIATYSTPGFMDSKHDILLALMSWVENGTAPDKIVATKYTNDTVAQGVSRQRPICPFPKQARYIGTGDVNVAKNWKCELLY